MPTYVALFTTEGAHELPMPAYAYGVIAGVIFAVLLAVTWAFRGAAQRHAGTDHGDTHH